MVKPVACQMHYNIIRLDGCAYNVTVLNPTKKDQWKNIEEINEVYKLIPFFDDGYQEFATGDLEENSGLEVASIKGFEFLCSQSFAKIY